MVDVDVAVAVVDVVVEGGCWDLTRSCHTNGTGSCYGVAVAVDVAVAWAGSWAETSSSRDIAVAEMGIGLDTWTFVLGIGDGCIA